MYKVLGLGINVTYVAQIYRSSQSSILLLVKSSQCNRAKVYGIANTTILSRRHQRCFGYVLAKEDPELKIFIFLNLEYLPCNRVKLV